MIKCLAKNLYLIITQQYLEKRNVKDNVSIALDVTFNLDLKLAVGRFQSVIRNAYNTNTMISLANGDINITILFYTVLRSSLQNNIANLLFLIAFTALKCDL